MAVVVVVVGLGVVLLREPGGSPGAKATQSTEPTSAAEVSPAATDAAIASIDPSIDPTITPAAETIGPAATPKWVVPGPDATVPPKVGVISGLGIDALAGAWESVGLSCESYDADGAFTLYCERADEGQNIQYIGEAVYFTPSGVMWVSMKVRHINTDAIDGTSAATEFFLPSAELADGLGVREWVQDQIGDPACREACRWAVDWGRLSLTIGSRGSHTLYLVADTLP